jgi:hypothetical protein
VCMIKVEGSTVKGIGANIRSFVRKTEIKTSRQWAVAQTNHSPFESLRANDGMLKSGDFSVHAERGPLGSDVEA